MTLPPQATKTLSELAVLHGTDKGPDGHGFTSVYARILDPVRQTVSRVLEIGVYTGASIRMWRDYFPNAMIIGADENLANATPTGERTKLVAADQSRVDSLEQLAAKGPFDVIIDDGSHAPEHQVLTFQTLFCMM